MDKDTRWNLLNHSDIHSYSGSQSKREDEDDDIQLENHAILI